jgi:hypothetical protein
VARTKLTIIMFVDGPEPSEVAEYVDTLLDNGAIQGPIAEFVEDRLGEGTFEVTSAACLTESV